MSSGTVCQSFRLTPKFRSRSGRVAGTVDSRKRDEQTFDAPPGDGIVRLQVALTLARAGEDDRGDDACLMHLALQFLERDCPPPRRDGFFDGKPGVYVHNAKSELQFQHHTILRR